jgi:transformation/transcription domain-associated protein
MNAKNLWKAGEEAKIADALINVFHLLPAMAGKFLDELLKLSIDLERVLPQSGTYSELCSPYRASITRYLNMYKSEAVDYFLATMPINRVTQVRCATD